VHDVRHLGGELFAPVRIQAQPGLLEIGGHGDDAVGRQLGAQGRDRVAEPPGRLAWIRTAHESVDSASGAAEVAQEHLAADETGRAGQQDRALGLLPRLGLHWVYLPGQRSTGAHAE